MDKIEQLTSKEFCAAMSIRANSGLSTSAEHTQLLLYLANRGQIRIFQDNYFRPIGYVAWSKVTKDTLNLIPALQGNIKYPYERTSGYLYWIDDLVIEPRYRLDGRKRWLRFFKKRRFIAYAKNQRLYTYIRRLNKHHLAQFSLQIAQKDKV
ncbi:toxin-activating lysine-acyltransferase [Catenovulum agarivorans]|uniref:toxin-activating lysine-acyltransferase n=1 Tax=Catenovulum agarivorans TaxID=1172192 RepID=UPI0002DADB94|nr:toxin-activating lysine-acyltransferase [Catenovulum agarivorans]